uniref:Spermatosis and centriole associated 1 like n=1 Tax=Poecilia reticulata TaxID=8081 RepID=A0A3P9MUS8_POERE
MSLEQAAAALLVKNDQLKREIEHLRYLVNLLQDNQMLTSRTHSSSDSILTDLTGKFPLLPPGGSLGLFYNGHPRLLGEIAYQLDRRILSYVFQAHQRLYGFILLNIPQRIVEVSTHPLTGHMDEAYQLYLSNRYTDLMESLGKLGYKLALHAPFCEFIVNSYGILKERPRKGSSKWAEYNNPDFLIKMIENIAPRRLQKDMLLVLSCLCYLSTKDKKPLLAW